MMMIDNIKKLYVVEADVPDLELIAARLESHHWTISADNMFLCDCGDNWKVELMNDENSEETITCHSPTLRRALAGALDTAHAMRKNR
jgi:hypothetical protein